MKIQIKKDFSKIKYIFLIFFSIYATDTLLFKTNVNSILRYISWFLIICLAIGYVLSKGFINRRKRLLYICIIMLFGMVVNVDITGGYFFKIALLFCGLFIADTVPWNEFKKIYVDLLCIISIVSLLGILFADFVISSSIFPIVTNGLVEFKCLFLSNVPLSASYAGGFERIRNYGPFWEPGVYQFYLIIAVVFCLFDNQKIKRQDVVRVILLSITILTTLSTAGYLMLGLVFLTFVFKERNYGGKFFLVIVAVIAVVYLLSDSSIYYLVFSKFEEGSSGIQSTNSRWYSIWANIYISFLNPFGVGPNGLEDSVESFRNAFQVFSNFSNINGLLQNFSVYGWVLGCFYTYKLWRFVKCFKENSYVQFLLFCVVILGLFNEPLLYSLMFNMIIFYDQSKGGIKINV